MVKIGVKKLREGIKLPEFSTTHAAGADIFLPEDTWIGRSYPNHIKLGFSLDIPEGYEVQVRAKSGLASRHGLTLTNGVGTIDSDYKGEVGVLITSLNTFFGTLEKGSKIAQLVVVPITPTEYVEVQELTETNSNRVGGFGSTGV